MPTRNVSLTPELEAFIDDRVTSGRYRSASEVVRAALRILAAAERQPIPPSTPARAAGPQQTRRP